MLSAISPEKAQYYYQVIFETGSTNLPVRDGMMRLRPLLDELFKLLVIKEKQSFGTLFQRMLYVFEVDFTPKPLVSKAHKFRKRANEVAHEISYQPSEAEFVLGIEILAQLVNRFSQIEIPTELKSIYGKQPLAAEEIAEPTDFSDYVAVVRGVVMHVGELKEQKRDNGMTTVSRRLFVVPEFPEDLPAFAVMLYGNNAQLPVQKYMTVQLIDLKRLNDNLYTLSTNGHLVIEPDVLINISDLAECVQRDGSNSLLYFINRFVSEPPTQALLAGTIIGSLFAQLIENKRVNFNVAYSRALKESAVIASRFDSQTLQEIYRKAQRNFGTLYEVRQSLPEAGIESEATFISSSYGLLGRLDALITEKPQARQVIELKSGKAPNYGTWPNHAAQANAYVLLMKSVYEGASCTSSILYSDCPLNTEPLRNVAHSSHAVDTLIDLRNQIVLHEMALANNDYGLLRRIFVKDFGDLPKFTEAKAHELSDLMCQASQEQQHYFLENAAFVAREHWIARVGPSDPNSTDEGFAALWLQQPSQKRFTVMQLQHPVEAKDNTIEFEIILKEDEATSFRTGDIVVVYPQEPDGGTRPQSHRLIKARIAVYDRDRNVVLISPSDRNINAAYFAQSKRWVLEPDIFDRNFVNLYRSLVMFLRAPEQRREVLLGKATPQFVSFPPQIKPSIKLNEAQYKVWREALSAKDYYLIQGPPGTGKTSYMLKALVKYLYECTEETILLLAYTNRAVGEMCKALDGLDFIKLGSREGVQESQLQHVLSEYARDHEIEEVRERYQSCRIIVSTVSTALGMLDLLERKQFNTAIIDESSQLLEPHLAGIVTQVDRFILIGDEKQLPAVVAQQPSEAMARAECLKARGIADLRMSVFERLLRQCKAMGWRAFGQLEEQARTHEKIVEFVNERYYGGTLRCFLPEQSAVSSHFPATEADENIRHLRERRILFASSDKPQVGKPKVHSQEAVMAARFAEMFYKVYQKANDYHAEKIGIITPFRAQVGEIYKNLPKHLKHITVDTVERYQGSERDVIIISFALVHPAQVEASQSLTTIDGVEIDRKLNVALTRAKQYLVMLGNPYVMRSSPHLSNLLDWALKLPTAKQPNW